MEGTPFGRYRLVKMLGRGGMGEVWQAYDTVMNRLVALKVLPPNLADDDTYQRRFRREAQMAAGLDEPHIVPIHDFGEIDGRLYVTMRLIDGRTIHEVLEAGPMSAPRAVGITEQIAAALHAAHRVGLVHRDVKPSNILVTDEDFAYLIDFGIARAAGATKLTSTGSTIGTLAYMAPERLSTDSCDARADVYALTCVLYECLTGSQPFPGDSAERQITGHLTLPPPRPSTVQPAVTAQMDQVIATGMAKNPEHRYTGTRDLAISARAAVAPSATPAHQPTAPGWPTPAPYPAADFTPAPQHHWPATPPPWQQPAAQPWWRGPAVLIPIGLVAVVAVAALAVVLLVSGRFAGSTDQQVATNAPRSSSTTTRSIAAQSNSPTRPPGPTELQSAQGLAALLQTVRDKFGDTEGYQLVVYPDYAVIDRADPTNAKVEQSYTYRGDGWQTWGSATSISSFDFLADLGSFDAPAVAATIAEAPQTLGAPDDAGIYLIVEGAEGGGLELAVYSLAPGTGFMQVDPNGSIAKVFPP